MRESLKKFKKKEFDESILKIMTNHKIPDEHHEHHENHRVPYENFEKNENTKIKLENY